MWHLLWQAGIQEIVISTGTRSLLLVSIIYLLFSPCNLLHLAYAICNLCLYFICNYKIINKVLECFAQISLEKNMKNDQVEYCHVWASRMRATDVWFVCHKIGTAKPLAKKVEIFCNRYLSQCPLLHNMQCQSPLPLKSDRCKSSILIKRSSNLSTLV